MTEIKLYIEKIHYLPLKDDDGVEPLKYLEVAYDTHIVLLNEEQMRLLRRILDRESESPEDTFLEADPAYDLD